tara:strand:- start:345 stop:545 length:201 start_codon:yes stop_codon:yes gene_type:complete
MMHRVDGAPEQLHDAWSSSPKSAIARNGTAMGAPFQLFYESDSFSLNKKQKKRVAAQRVGCDYYPA